MNKNYIVSIANYSKYYLLIDKNYNFPSNKIGKNNILWTTILEHQKMSDKFIKKYKNKIK